MRNPGTNSVTHPDAAQEPQRLSAGDALEWYVRPRDVDTA